jgi:2-phosphosulfolactate phosphatase
MHQPAQLEVLFTPTEFSALNPDALRETVCVVFDVLRATTSMITALAHGATALHPVNTVREALDLRTRNPHILLGGERHGLRITAETADGTDFDFGNSPAEYASPNVRGQSIAITTTNGTRALRATLGARQTFVASFLNLSRTADALRQLQPSKLLIVGAGTYEEAALEDTLAAGALCDLLWDLYPLDTIADSATVARLLFARHARNLPAALAQSRNGRRLLRNPQLCDDVAFAACRNRFPILARLHPDGVVRADPE